MIYMTLKDSSWVKDCKWSYVQVVRWSIYVSRIVVVSGNIAPKKNE